MTELEQQLTNALTALSKQYEAEMEQQAEWVGELQEQFAAARRIGQRLEAAARADRSVGQGFEAASRDIGQRTTRRSPKYCAGCERDLEAAATGAGAAARAGARLWSQPLILALGGAPVFGA